MVRSPYPVAAPGDTGEVVRFAQEILGVVPADGVYDRRLSVRVRGFRLSRGLEPRDFLDEATLAMLGWPGSTETGVSPRSLGK